MNRLTKEKSNSYFNGSHRKTSAEAGRLRSGRGKEADLPDHQPWPGALQRTGTIIFQAGAA